MTIENMSAKMSGTVKTEVIEQLENLPEHLQQQVLEFVQTLQTSVQRGVPGKQMLQFAGAIPLDDLGLMRQAVEDACEQAT